MANETIATIYRETVAEHGREGVDRSVAIDEATAKVLAEIKAGRYKVDQAAAIRASLIRIDEREGRTADQIIRRAAGTDGAQLETCDLDVIVTLGGGRRKPWGEVTAADLAVMNEIRFKNYRQAERTYKEFSEAYELLRESLFMHGTLGAAHAASGLPGAAMKPAA